MADRATHTRDTRVEAIAEKIQSTTQSTGEVSKKLAENIVDLYDDILEKQSRQIKNSDDLIRLQAKYKDNNVELFNVLADQDEELRKQGESVSFMLRKLEERGETDSSTYKKLVNQNEELEKQKKELSDLAYEKQDLMSTEEKLLAYHQRSAAAQQEKNKQIQQEIKNAEELAEIYKEQGNLEEARKQQAIADAKRKEIGENYTLNPSFNGLAGAIIKGFTERSKDKAGRFESVIDNKLPGVLDKVPFARKVTKGIDKLVDVMMATRSILNGYVTDATSFIKSNKGQLNAALYGYNLAGNQYGPDYYRQFVETAKNNGLAFSSTLEQKEYLQQIRQIASQGIAGGVETAALLQAVAEKTVPQFNATTGYIRRLVLLQEKNATERFFGLESIIQGSLNAQFGESSYLNQLFDSVNSNLLDAVTQLGDKLTGAYDFLGTTQTWLSYLYEQGVDQNTIQRMSTVINALGSGNVSGVSSDAGMQKLMLLAMDRANIDYATVLQEGLDSSLVDVLFQSMAEYLKNISKTTNSNNVLENAYANLFGLSMTDMYAFGQLAGRPTILNTDVTSVQNETQNRLNLVSDQAYTHLSEKIDNVLNNMKFEFGNSIASSNTSYGTWVLGNLTSDIGQSLTKTNRKGERVQTKLGKFIEGLGGLALLADTVWTVGDMITDFAGSYKAINNNNGSSLNALYSAVSGHTSTDISDNSSVFKTLTSSNNPAEAATYTGKAGSKEEQNTREELMNETETESDDVRILKELEKTLMKNKAGNYAVAVSLEAMSDEVLKSFASIFADEESMTDVFKTKKSKNKLFDYSGEETSSSAQAQGAGRTITGTK